MSRHVLTLSAVLLASATPAFADCAQEIGELEARYKETETSAPETKHQAEALTMQQGQTETPASPPASGEGPAAAASEHQREVLEGSEQAPSDQEQFAAILSDAKKLAEEGNEEACLERSAAARELLGGE